MNVLAQELNQIIENSNPHLFSMLSEVGKQLFFPKGILSQSAEAREKAHNMNATIGIAKENDGIMCFSSVNDCIEGIAPEASLSYAPSFGIPDLRKVWKESLFTKSPSLKGKEISLPVVTCGITHAVSIFADVWTDPGDVVIVPDLMWGNYNMIFNTRKGAELSHYPMFDDKNGFNVNGFEKKIIEETEKRDKVVVLINCPHNPTGYTITNKEADQIADILTNAAGQGKNVIALLDDAYFGLFYEDNALKESLFARLSGRHERLLAVKVDGVTKEYYAWGLRVGFITYGCKTAGDVNTVYDALEKKTAGCVRGNVSNCSHLGQSIILKSMQSESYPIEKKEKFETLKQRANRVKEVLADPKYNDAWDVYPFNSGYFMCIKLKTVNAEELRKHLLEKYGVGLIALGDKNARIAFSCIEAKDIQALFDTILQGVNDLK